MCLSGDILVVVRVLFGFLILMVVIVTALNGGVCCSVRVRFSDIRGSGFMVGALVIVSWRCSVFVRGGISDSEKD